MWFQTKQDLNVSMFNISGKNKSKTLMKDRKMVNVDASVKNIIYTKKITL